MASLVLAACDVPAEDPTDAGSSARGDAAVPDAAAAPDGAVTPGRDAGVPPERDAGAQPSRDAGAPAQDAAAGPDAAVTVQPCTGTAADFDSVFARFSQELAEQSIPGGAIAVVCNDVIHARAAGVLRRGQAASVDVHSRFQIASTTKMLTAMVAMTLVEDGTLNLGSAVRTYVPQVNDQAPFTRPFTVEELLSHRAGYPLELGVGWSNTLEAFFTGPAANIPLWTPPGAVWAYSNDGFALAGLVLQRAAGMPYRTLVTSRIFAPLDLLDSTMDETTLQGAPNVAMGHTPGGATMGPMDNYTHQEVYGPMGGAWMSVEDLAKVARSMVSGGQGVMDAASVVEMSRSRGRTFGHGMDYALGLFVDELGNQPYWSHGGGVAGYTTDLTMLPQSRFAVVTLINTDEGYIADAPYLAINAFTNYGFDGPGDMPRPADLPLYVGTYRQAGDGGNIVVTQSGGTLNFRFPGNNQLRAGTAVGRDLFRVFHHEAGYEIDVAFWPDQGAVSPYVTSRAFVGVRN